MPVDVDNSPTAFGEGSGCSSGPSQSQLPPQSTPKKKRNLPGMPDPDAEVISLSPKTLMATNRFICEICNKGFQRDQNLQLHRRGHNLPWKLKQRSSKDVVKKRVYVCPESTCVHHDPSRALGDLTGIKKHFCRKHGEKKWKCDKCSKKYAVQSDWKAHSKICGTREYKCDCGTMFSRRDSFITHRAFCDALAEESARAHPPNPKVHVDSPASSPPPVPASPAIAKAQVSPIQSPELPESQDQAPIMEEPPAPASGGTPTVTVNASCSCSSSSSSNGSTSSTVFASLFASSTSATTFQPPPQTQSFTELIRAMAARPEHIPPPPPSSCTEPISLCLSTSPIFGQYAPAPQPAAMSATALLQKAAQMGATATNTSLLRGLGIVSSSSPSSAMQHDNSWGQRQGIEPSENSSVHPGLGLGLLPCDGGSGLKELMMGTPSMFGPKHATLDFLGLGMAAGGSPSSGLSALITSIGGGLASFGGKDIGSSS
ncbi:Zinc finger protein ENHYDROUS [Linum grandiflorum]